jgi:WhiB family redox-sensing transcriptional regulator
VLYDATRKWVDQGSCRTVDPGRFFAPGAGQPNRSPVPAVQALWNEAKKICSFCPVMEQCRRDTLGEEYGVWGGVDEHERYLLRKRLPRRAAKWEPKLRLAWGENLYALRKQGVSWTRIRHMTGMSERLCLELIEDWREHLRIRAEQAAAKVVDLPLPELRTGPEFPATPGRCHGWVRHNSLVNDAHYRGQTADGAWVFMSLMAGGRHNSHVWVRAENVQLYRPQPPVILEYIGRPDRASPTAQAG